MDKVKKNKIIGVIYILSLFNITLELGYTRRFNHLISQKIGDINSAEGSITSTIDEEESEDNKEEDNKGDNKKKDNKRENNKKEDYKRDDKKKDNIEKK